MDTQGTRQPSILLTNVYLMNRAGSELHTLMLAKNLTDAGWDVTCLTLIYAYPMRHEFESAGIMVLTLDDKDKLRKHYDVLFAQHATVSEYVWYQCDVTFGSVVISILSVTNDIERVPSFWQQADAFVFVSEEAKSANLGHIDVAKNVPILVFPNYAEKAFFDVPEHELPHAPTHACCISNHPPAEVYELAKQSDKTGFSLDIFGMETRSIDVTPELLDSYDLVITIGRTVQDCLAAGVPCYCYDYFGGPGYITCANWEQHAWYNFSGRSEPTQRNADELYQNIQKGYEEATQGTHDLRIIAKEHFNLEKLFDEFLQLLDSLPRGQCKGKGTCSLEKTDQLMRDCANLVLIYQNFEGIAQIFYAGRGHEGGPYTEERSVWFRYAYGSDIKVCLSDFHLHEDVCAVRFDPDVRPCKVLVYSAAAEPFNAFSCEADGTATFLTEDPIYLTKASDELAFRAQRVPFSEVEHAITELKDQVARLEAEAAAAKEKPSLSTKLGRWLKGRHS